MSDSCSVCSSASDASDFGVGMDNSLLHFCGIVATTAPENMLRDSHAYLKDKAGKVTLNSYAVSVMAENARTLPWMGAAREYLKTAKKHSIFVSGNPSRRLAVTEFVSLPRRTESWLAKASSKCTEETVLAMRLVLQAHHIQCQWKMHCRKCSSCNAFGTSFFALFSDLSTDDATEILQDFPFDEPASLSKIDFHTILDIFEIVPPEDTPAKVEDEEDELAPTPMKLSVSAAAFVPKHKDESAEDDAQDDIISSLLEEPPKEQFESIFSTREERPAGVVKNGIQFPGRGSKPVPPPAQQRTETSHIQKLIDQEHETGVPAAPREWVQAVVDQALMQAQSAIFAGIRARQGELVGAMVNKKHPEGGGAKSSDSNGETDGDESVYMPIPWSWCPWLPKESLYRVKMCSYYYYTGHCNKGDACNFSHEMLPGMAPPKPPASVRHGLNSKKASPAKPFKDDPPSFKAFAPFDDHKPALFTAES